MFDQYAVITHKILDAVIMIPNEWPARAEPLLMTLVEKIIEHFNDSSPIVRVNNIPKRLIRLRRDAPTGSVYVFDQVAEREITGAYIYDVIVPENGEAIRLEITSGTSLSAASWSPPEQTPSHIGQIYYSISSPKLRRKVLSAVDSNKDTSCRDLRRKRYGDNYSASRV